jgi:4-amino-4-deoxy-L-arabinose transferase-like glycosyltransferase
VIQKNILTKIYSRFSFLSKTDIAFVIFMMMLSVTYYYQVSKTMTPVWDSVVYMANAHGWLNREPLFEIFRPPLISWLISAIWMIAGESSYMIKYLHMAFTIGSGFVLYIALKKNKNNRFAFGVSALTMLNSWILVTSSQLLTEGISLFFVVLTLYFVKGQRPRNWVLAGTSIGLTFASRYPIVLQSLLILIVESLIRKNPKILTYALKATAPIIAILVFMVYLKTGTFQTALAKDTVFTPFLSPFYVTHSIDIWGLAFVLVPIAFLFRKTYEDKNNYTYIIWFLISIIFWSANSSNYEERFAIQFTPAVYYLAVLSLENIINTRMKLKDLILGKVFEKIEHLTSRRTTIRK